MELASLIQQTLAGNKQAFGVIFDRYKNLVYKTAVLLLADSQDADEALQEVFLKVYRSLSSYQPEKGAFTTWLYHITTNYCLNQRRRKQFARFALQWAERDNHHNILSWDDHLDEDQDLELALRNLSDKLRVVVVLRFYNGLSYAEIAESLDIPIGTVKSRLDLAMKTLRRELQAANLEGLAEKDEVA
jgi:RNA polymerase sigma-70 factor (ECF subfamily)